MRAKVHDQVVAKDRGLRSGRSAALALAVALAALAGWPLHAAADVVIWDGGGTDTNWGTSGNWSTDTVPATTDTAQFDSNTTATLEADHTIQGISLGANTLTLDGGNTLYLNTSGSENITGTGTLSISNGTTLDVRGRYHAGNESFVIVIAGSGVGGAGAIVNTSSSLVNANGFSNLRLTADATIGGTGRLDFGSGGFIDSQGHTLTKTGTGDVWLGSSAANTNLPFVDVVGGTFGLQGDNVLGSSSTVTVYSGGNLATWSNRQSNNNVVLDGGRLRSNNYNFGNLNATAVWNPGSAGVLAVLSDSSLYTYQANMTLNVPLSGSGNLTRSASSGTPSATYNAFGTENLTLNVSNGAWTGALTNNGGKVTIGHAEALGTSAVTHAFNAGSTLDLNGFDISTQPYTIQLAGTGIPIPVGDLASPTGYDPPGALVNSSYTAAAIGRVTLTADTTIGDGDIVFNGIVDGAFALTKMGSGTLTFNAANSWGGATNVEVGTVVVGTNNALPTTTTVTLGLDTQSATLQLDGNSQMLAGLVVSGAGTDNRVVNGSSTAGALTLNVASATTNTFDGTLGGSTSDDNNFSLTKTGGGTLVLTAANSYTGVTNIQQGTLEVTSPAALGSTAGGTNVADGAVLVINHGTGFSEAITLNGLSNPDGALQSGSVNNYGVGGTITLAATSNVGTPTRALTLNGKITGPGGLVKVGNGTLYLGNTTNDYQGSTVVDGGVLKLIHSNTIPDTSDLTINNGARFDNVERPTSDTVGLVTINQGSITGSASTVITSNAGFRLHEGSVSAVLGGTGELWKESATTFTLSQANTYTGDTRINDGTLALTSDGSIHASPTIYLASTGVLDVSGVTGGDYTLAGGQTVTGSGGVVGALTIGAGSIVSPGNSPGTLTHTGDETWAGGGTYLWEINSANGTLGADPGWDYLDISGTLTIDATPSDPFDIDITSLTLAGSAGLVSDFHSTGIYSWAIATADGGVVNFSPENFNLVLEDFANDWSAGQWSIDLIGNSVVLSFAVPEPSSIALLASLLVAGLAFGGLRRCRKRSR